MEKSLEKLRKDYTKAVQMYRDLSGLNRVGKKGNALLKKIESINTKIVALEKDITNA